MTQEQKELLLKDLCTRLPYGVKVQCEDYLFTFDKDHMGIGMLYKDFNRNPLESPKIILSGCYYGENIKPYLFPLSSMTEEQREEALPLLNNCDYYDIEGTIKWLDKHPIKFFDWCNKNHFDYRSLIEKGLAIDATGLNIY